MNPTITNQSDECNETMLMRLQIYTVLAAVHDGLHRLQERSGTVFERNSKWEELRETYRVLNSMRAALNPFACGLSTETRAQLIRSLLIAIDSQVTDAIAPAEDGKEG